MSISEVQAVLARLYVDENFRKLFLIDINTTLQNYKLAPNEFEQLAAVDKSYLERYAAGLRNTNQNNFRFIYKLTFKLLGNDAERYHNRYYQLYGAKPEEIMLDRFLSFGKFLEQTVTGDADLPIYAADLIRYERLCCLARFSPAALANAKEFAVDKSNLMPVLTAEVKPILDNATQYGTFDFNISSIANQLRTDQSVTELEKGEYCFIFQPQAAGKLKIFKISSLGRDLLEYCNGFTTLAAIERRLQKVHKTLSAEAVRQLLTTFYNAGVLQFN